MPPWAHVLLVALFGSPEAATIARARAGIDTLCPCAPLDASCSDRHALAAWTVGVVAANDRDPDEALALLVGLGAHESCFRIDRQIGEGPAVSWWQLEPTAWTRAGRAEQAAAWLADPPLAATVALARARTCGGDLSGYATGRCLRGSDIGRELGRYAIAGRWATR